MPYYEYKCPFCNRTWEAYHTVAERYFEKCIICSQSPYIMLSTAAKPVVYDYYNESLDRYITGPGQFEKILKETNSYVK